MPKNHYYINTSYIERSRFSRQNGNETQHTQLIEWTARPLQLGRCLSKRLEYFNYHFIFCIVLFEPVGQRSHDQREIT
jgi:hypothetical protein